MITQLSGREALKSNSGARTLRHREIFAVFGEQRAMETYIQSGLYTKMTFTLKANSPYFVVVVVAFSYSLFKYEQNVCFLSHVFI